MFLRSSMWVFAFTDPAGLDTEKKVRGCRICEGSFVDPQLDLCPYCPLAMIPYRHLYLVDANHLLLRS